jgi:hypothetical protein
MRPPFIANPLIKTYQSNAYALGAFLSLGEGASGILDDYFVSWYCVPDVRSAPRPILFTPHIAPDTFSACGLGAQQSFRANTEFAFGHLGSNERNDAFACLAGITDFVTDG